MSDVDLILQLQKEISLDPEPATLTMTIDVFDPVAVEIFLLESDAAVEVYMTKWRRRFREQFENPVVYDNYVLAMQANARKTIHEGIAETQQTMTLLGMDTSGRDPFAEPEEGDDDGGV